MAGGDGRPSTNREILAAIADGQGALFDVVGNLRQELHESLSTLTDSVNSLLARTTALEARPQTDARFRFWLRVNTLMAAIALAISISTLCVVIA